MLNEIKKNVGAIRKKIKDEGSDQRENIAKPK